MGSQWIEAIMTIRGDHCYTAHLKAVSCELLYMKSRLVRGKNKSTPGAISFVPDFKIPLIRVAVL